MTNHNTEQKYLDELLISLKSDKLSEIDFDKLTEWLQEIKTTLDNSCKLQLELKLMREDYLNRIAGMVKAVTIVERSSAAPDKVLTYLEDLENLSAAELIEQYRKTSHRFRLAFPTTFGLPPASNNSSARLRETNDYK